MKLTKLRFKNLLITIGITLALLELTLRMLPEYGTSIAKIIKTDIGWIYFREPNSRYLHHIEQDHRVYYNNFGFHDVDYFPSSKINKTKVGFIGDSFVEGREIRSEDNFVFKTRQYTLKEGLPYEIYNFGVNNTGTAGQYVIWKYYIKDKFKLDQLVLCIFLGNDLDNNNSFKERNPNYSWSVTENGKVYQPPFDSTWTKKVGFWVRKNSALVNTARLFYWNLYQNDFSLAGDSKDAIVSNDKTAASLSREDSLTCLWSIQLIENWNRELKEERTELSIMIFSDQTGVVNANEAYFMQLLDAMVAKENISMQQVQFQNPMNKHFLWSQNGTIRLGHFNENGHDSVSKIACKMLFKQ